MGGLAEGANNAVQVLDDYPDTPNAAGVADAIADSINGDPKLTKLFETSNALASIGNAMQVVSAGFSIASEYEKNGGDAAFAEAVYQATKAGLEVALSQIGAQAGALVGAVLGGGAPGAFVGGVLGGMAANYLAGVLADYLFKPNVELAFGAIEFEGLDLQGAIVDLLKNEASSEDYELLDSIEDYDYEDVASADPNIGNLFQHETNQAFRPVPTSASGNFFTATNTVSQPPPKIFAFQIVIDAPVSAISSVITARGFTSIISGPGFTQQTSIGLTAINFSFPQVFVGPYIVNQRISRFPTALGEFFLVNASFIESNINDAVPTGNYSLDVISPVNNPSTLADVNSLTGKIIDDVLISPGTLSVEANISATSTTVTATVPQ